MTTQEALLAMKIGCKIRADWMKPELFYYIKGDNYAVMMLSHLDLLKYMNSVHFLMTLIIGTLYEC